MQTSNSTQQHPGAARRDCLDTSTEPVPGREGEPAVSPHLALLCLRPKNFCGGGALPQKQTQSVLLQAHVPNGPGRLPSLLPGVDKHQHLSRNQVCHSQDTAHTAPAARCRGCSSISEAAGLRRSHGRNVLAQKPQHGCKTLRE